MISHYNKSHVGHLPVRVLQHNVLYQFENTSSEFYKRIKTVIDRLGLSSDIFYHVNVDATHGCPVYGPCVEIKTKQIHIQESFLAYIWCICFALLRYVDGLIAEATGQSPLKGCDNDCRKLLDYAHTLLKKYADWDKAAMPNPEQYEERNKEEIEKVNELFVYAINFTLCHEFVHVEEKHVDSIGGSNSLERHERLEFETEADKKAIHLMISSGDSDPKLEAKKTAIIFALCAILITKGTVGAHFHPDNDIRIANAIDAFDVDDNDRCWLVACASLNLWSNMFGAELMFEERNSFKNLFHDLSRQIQN